jgi:hypothetical protein
MVTVFCCPNALIADSKIVARRGDVKGFII